MHASNYIPSYCRVAVCAPVNTYRLLRDREMSQEAKLLTLLSRDHTASRFSSRMERSRSVAKVGI